MKIIFQQALRLLIFPTQFYVFFCFICLSDSNQIKCVSIMYGGVYRQQTPHKRRVDKNYLFRSQHLRTSFRKDEKFQ